MRSQYRDLGIPRAGIISGADTHRDGRERVGNGEPSLWRMG